MRRSLLTLFLTAMVALLAGSCSEDDGTTGTWEPCDPSSGAVSHPTGESEVVFRIGLRGGLPPPAFMPDSLADLTLYGDGRLVGIDATTGGTLVPGLAEHRLTEEEVQALLHGAEAACLVEDDAFVDLPGTYDVPGIAFTVDAGSGPHLTHVVGLGFGELESSVPEGQREQRAALIALEIRAMTLMDEATPIATGRLGIFVSETDRPSAQDDWPVATWPLETSLRKLAKASPEAYPEVGCAIVEGRDAQAVLAVVEGLPAGQIPYWEDGGHWYQLDLRPMLPDETDCVALVD